MSDPKSITQWIVDLKQGNEEAKNAAAQLWERYFEKMVQAARRKVGRTNHGAADAEDVALSVFDSLCRGIAEGRFSQLKDRSDLWPLLLTLTAQKSVDLLRWEGRQRRGGGKVRREEELTDADGTQVLDRIVSQIPTAEFQAMMEEEYSRLLAGLRDDTLRSIVKWKLEGHTNACIAEFLDVSVHTVGRKLRLIRLTWSQELS
jgi:DNA-directed RNA polymerase specialized sigma24 family protein